MHRSTLIGALASVSVAALASETITYSYDTRGRLVQVAHAGTVNNGLVSGYAFDKANNRTSMTHSGGSSLPTSLTPRRAIVVPLAGFQIIPLFNK